LIIIIRLNVESVLFDESGTIIVFGEALRRVGLSSCILGGKELLPEQSSRQSPTKGVLQVHPSGHLC
jgi:hypothetical protein